MTERFNRILQNEDFLRALRDIDKQEENRIYCRHGEEHLLAVARTAALIAADDALTVDRELLYAAAFLHDLGRCSGDVENHEVRSVDLASKILTECGFSCEERRIILTAISEHRSSWKGERSLYGYLLFRADKESRPCFACRAEATCSWSEDKKNIIITY